MKKDKTGETGFMVVKLDMSKVYDSVEWGYLENLMRKMCLNERWIGLVMVCVRTMIEYTQRGGLDKETHYLIFSSFYVRKAYRGSFNMQP